MKRTALLAWVVCLGALFCAGCGSGPETGADEDAQETMADTMGADTMAGAAPGGESAPTSSP